MTLIYVAIHTLRNGTIAVHGAYSTREAAFEKTDPDYVTWHEPKDPNPRVSVYGKDREDPITMWELLAVELDREPYTPETPSPTGATQDRAVSAPSTDQVKEECKVRFMGTYFDGTGEDRDVFQRAEKLLGSQARLDLYGGSLSMPVILTAVDMDTTYPQSVVLTLMSKTASGVIYRVCVLGGELYVVEQADVVSTPSTKSKTEVRRVPVEVWHRGRQLRFTGGWETRKQTLEQLLGDNVEMRYNGLKLDLILYSVRTEDVVDVFGGQAGLVQLTDPRNLDDDNYDIGVLRDGSTVLMNPEPEHTAGAKSKRDLSTLMTEYVGKRPCQRHAMPGDVFSGSCPECGHMTLVHPGPGNPSLEACVICELQIQTLAAKGVISFTAPLP